MYAILALKRTYTNNGLNRYLVDFEIISMGCFNGLNLPRAFTPGQAGGSRDLTIEVTHEGHPIAQNRADVLGPVVKAYGNTGAEGIRMRDSLQGWTAGEVETLGIGYLSYVAGASQKSYTQLHTPDRTTQNEKANPYVGEALLREGFISPYRNPVLGGRTPSLRVLTPNEQFLNNVVQPFENASSGFDATLRDNYSKMAVTMTCNRHWRGALYQMVGSERPSGQAIAYLQAWRNTAEVNNQYGFENNKGQLQVVTHIASNSAWRGKSLIAVLSHLFNNGDDSDIITFAGNHYMSYCTRVGFWNTTSLFRDQSSMMVEGRYNKGGQSSAIRDRLYQARSLRSRARWHDLWNTSLGRQLDDMKGSYDDHSNLATAVSANTLAAYSSRGGYSDRDRQRHIENINRYINSIWMNDNTQALATFLAESQALPDLNVVVEAAPTEQPAGFVQWVAEATIH